MAINIASANPDVLDPQFKKIWNDTLNQVESTIPKLYSMEGTGPRKDSVKLSQMGTMTDWTQMSGTIPFNTINQGYDSTFTHLVFVNGYQVERELMDDDLHAIFSERPRGLATSYTRTREKHGARLWNNAFSNDTFFQTHSEGVAMCSDSHTTTSGASTTAGFDNRVTTGLSAVSLAAARLQMMNFRGDQAEKISIVPDELLVPIDLEEIAWEINNSRGQLDSANNNRNFLEGRYKIIPWIYLTDVNNWFLHDSQMRASMVKWFDRVPVEFGMVEDFDSLTGKWRGYARYSRGYRDWRFGLGSEVS